MIRIFLQIILFLLPWKIRSFFLIKLLKFEISVDAKIGYSIVLSKKLKLGVGARIGSLTFVKGLRLLSIGDYGSLGNLNWVSGFPDGDSRHFSHVVNRNPSLIIGEHAAITNRHLIDCTDKVEIGRYSTFAGFRSQILTHSIDLETSRQSCRPVSIGEYCFVGTACVLLGGSVLPDRSVLGAMSILNCEFSDEGVLYGGVPAKAIKPLGQEYKYFSRHVGFVD